eukprot:TRINITY_DN32768_c0_g1_i1.p1 TRINITY_DN32768_c0_g1~~TRINITY_DN32768_c0_g1_i1.p1  ORF type:complete len:184 (+),score=39.64 TRINITY_DN32768_c0_g1_i1:197-748(+)
MVDGVLPGQDGAGLELLQLQVHPSLPLNILRNCLIIPEFPQTAEAGEELDAQAVPVKYWDNNKREEQEGLGEQQDVEVDVWVGEHLVLTPVTLIVPVPGTAWVAWLVDTLDRDAGNLVRSEAHQQHHNPTRVRATARKASSLQLNLFMTWYSDQKPRSSGIFITANRAMLASGFSFYPLVYPY